MGKRGRKEEREPAAQSDRKLLSLSLNVAREQWRVKRWADWAAAKGPVDLGGPVIVDVRLRTDSTPPSPPPGWDFHHLFQKDTFLINSFFPSLYSLYFVEGPELQKTGAPYYSKQHIKCSKKSANTCIKAALRHARTAQINTSDIS